MTWAEPAAAQEAEQPAAGKRAAAEDTALTSAEAKEKQNPPIFFLRDNSKITGSPRLESLTVETHYGKLDIPRDQLVRVRLARRLGSDLRERIERLIADLGNEDFDKREGAMQGLRGIGPAALELLRGAAKAANEEVKNRSEILIGELDAKAAEKPASADDSMPSLAGAEDEVVTTKMTIKGRIPLEEFLIDTRYGELRVTLADLTGVVFRSSGSAVTKVDVTPQHQPPNLWLDTKLELSSGQKLKLEASGQISVRNYGIVTGPDGTREWSGSSFNNLPLLALVGKIGKRGEPFQVGHAYSTKVRASGRLYLGIVAFSPYPTGAAGNYQVKIQATGGP